METKNVLTFEKSKLPIRGYKYQPVQTDKPKIFGRIPTGHMIKISNVWRRIYYDASGPFPRYIRFNDARYYITSNDIYELLALKGYKD